VLALVGRGDVSVDLVEDDGRRGAPEPGDRDRILGDRDTNEKISESLGQTANAATIPLPLHEPTVRYGTEGCPRAKKHQLMLVPFTSQSGAGHGGPMRLQHVATPIEVPANASRFLSSAEAAQIQLTATVQLAWWPDDPYLFNSEFDESKIAHDASYCTSVVNIDQVVQVPTARYFNDRVVPHAGHAPRVLDIGCGQGEFVEALRGQGINAVGFDPVLRNEREYLHARYWSPGEAAADIFVMRCVLPHIPDPWQFIGRIADANPEALVLIEYQRLEWILECGIWYQISHDHVNLFTAQDFEVRFVVIDQGTFSEGEWGWVLIRASAPRSVEPRSCAVAEKLDELLDRRSSTLEAAAASDRPIVIWGAAGKGIVLGHALRSAGAPVIAAIDADPLRQGLYMEVSGIPILPPAEALDRVPADAIVLVCNPNHLAEIRQRIGDSWDLRTPTEFVTGA
jgi:hypothetical protein